MSEQADEYALDHSIVEKALQSDLVVYQVSSAEERKNRDQLVAHWSSLIHAFLKMPTQNDYKLLHLVVDSMEDFLNHAGGGRRK